MKHFILLLLVALMVSTGCKKKYEKRYPEDTENTYLTPAERLCDKWWVLDSVSLNGVDYTDSVAGIIGQCTFFVHTAEFDEIGIAGLKYRNGTVNTQNSISKLNFHFYLENDLSLATFYPNNSVFNRDTILTLVPHFFRPYTAHWDVRKLSATELKLQLQAGDTLLVNYYKIY